MAKIEQFSRIINHRVSTAGTTFTIPTSNDHSDETWLATDLYIGEFGVNVTDDKVYVRTNNGIIELGTTASGGSGSSGPFVFNSPNIEIDSSLNADSLTPKNGKYTDLGSTSRRWKDLNIGGSSTGTGIINANTGLIIREVNNFILSTDSVVQSNAPIEIGAESSNEVKDRGLSLNSRNSDLDGNSESVVVISSKDVRTSNNKFTTAISSNGATFEDGIVNATHIGKSFNKLNSNSDELVVGGKLSVRGMSDDGSGNYNHSDWITSQARLRTSDALVTPIVNIPWIDPTEGEVIQVKAYIIGTDINDSSKSYSSEIMFAATNDGGVNPSIIGAPINNSVSNVGEDLGSSIGIDNDGVYVNVRGTGTDTIQWLCSYSYHKMINIV